MRSRKVLALGLWMNGIRVGTWCVSAKGEHELRYDPDWVAAPRGRPISLSMPLRPANVPYKGDVVRNFFENLLPDNEAMRKRLARQFGTGTDAFELLSEIGRDCVGALQLLPDGNVPADCHAIQAAPLSERDIEQRLTKLRVAPSFGMEEDGTFRVSLAGAQEKTAFLRHAGAWCRPEASTPTTHIFKLPLGHVPGGIDLSTSVENEWLCLQLLRAFEVPTTAAEMLQFGQEKILCVERFDRRRSEEGGWLRLPQEDFAQVFGMDPDSKYESDGGPGVREILGQLTGSSNAAGDRRDFFRTQILFWMLAAIDGHAKNFSIFIEPRGLYRLTPRYDVLSAYPVMGTRAGRISPYKVKMAMAAWGDNRHFKWLEIRRKHFERMAADCKVPDAAAILDELIGQTSEAIATVQAQLPANFPPEIADAVFLGVAKAALLLQDQ